MDIMKNHDAAKRLSDAVNLHITVAISQGDIAGAYGKWVAAKLEDGSSDGALYDTKQQAVDHQSNPKICCYVKIPPDGMSVQDAWTFLKVNRLPMIDTTAPEHVINPRVYPRFSNLTAEQKRTLVTQEQRMKAAARDN